MNSIVKTRKGLLVSGYVLHLVSLAMPAVRVEGIFQGGILLGLECWAVSVLAVLPTPTDSHLRMTFDEVITILAGLANLWWTISWFPLLFLYRLRSFNVAWGMMGYLAFAASLASSLVVERVYIGYFFWSISFFLIASGLMSEVILKKRNAMKNGVRCE